MSLMFDSLAYAKRLKAAGVPDAQAEIQAETLVAWMEDRLATKLELEHVQVDLKRDIKELDVKIESIRADLKRDIKELDTKAEVRSKELDTKAEVRFKELDTKAEVRFKELDVKIESVRSELKRDIKELDTKAEIRFKEMDTKFEVRLKELEQRMVIKLGSLMVVAVGAMAALVKLL